MRIVSILAALLVSVQGFATLPPFFQAKKEIEAILSSQEINQYIPVEDTIMQITKTPMGYMIITDHRLVAVEITYLESRQLGPARFKVEFQCPVEFRGDCGRGSCVQN